jgi:hypothetical protein
MGDPMRALIAFILIACVTACATLNEPDNKVLAKIGTQYATMRFVEGAPESDRPERRERIRLVAADVLAAVKSDEQATIPALDAFVRSRIPWDKLSPSDTLLANSLIDVVEQELMSRVGDQTIPQDQLILVAEFMQWIIEATNMGVQS